MWVDAFQCLLKWKLSPSFLEIFEKAKYILKSRSSSVIPNIMRYWKPHNFQMTSDAYIYIHMYTYIHKKRYIICVQCCVPFKGKDTQKSQTSIYSQLITTIILYHIYIILISGKRVPNPHLSFADYIVFSSILLFFCMCRQQVHPVSPFYTAESPAASFLNIQYKLWYFHTFVFKFT